MKNIKKYLLYAIILGTVSFVLFAGVLWFAVTNSACITGIILPLAGKSAGIPIAAERVDFSLLDSKISIRNLLVGEKSAPLMSAGELRAVYHLKDIMSGKINIDEVTLENAGVRIIKNKNGTSNIPGDSSTAKASEPEKKNDKSESFVKSFDVKNINIRNLSFYFDQANENGTVTKAAVEKVNLSIPSIKNGDEIKLAMSGNLMAGSGDNINIKSALLDVKATVILDNGNMPSKVDFVSRINSINGNIDKFEMNNQEFVFYVNVIKEKETYYIKKISFNETSGSELLSAIYLSGSASEKPQMLDLNIDIPRISPQIIEFIQGMTGSNYKCSNANVKYKGKLLCSGDVYMAKGDLSISNVTVKNIETSVKSSNPVALLLSHDISINKSKEEADLKSLSLEISENKVKTVEMELVNPSAVTWNGNNKDVAAFQPKFKVRFKNFDLQQLNVFMPEKAHFSITGGQLNGEIGADLKLAQSADSVKGKNDSKPQLQVQKINMNGELLVSKLGVKSPSYTNSGISISEKFSAQITDNSLIKVNALDTTVMYADKTAAAINLKADFNVKENRGSVEIMMPYMNENIAKVLPEDLRENPGLKNMFTKLAPFTLAMKSEADFKFGGNGTVYKVNTLSSDFFTGKSKVLSLVLNEPLSISMKNEEVKDAKAKSTKAVKNESTNEISTIKATLVCNSELGFLNAFMPEGNECKFYSGKINSTLKILAKNNLSSIGAAGTLNLENANFQTAPNEKYTDLDLTQKVHVELNSFDKFKIVTYEADASYQKKKAAGLDAAGELNFSEKSGNININLKYLNETAFQMVPQLREKMNIRNIDANAKTVLGYSEKAGYLMLTGDINISNLQNDKLPQPIRSNMSINFIKTTDRIELKKFICKVNDKSNLLADLNMSANIFMKAGQGKSTASLTSEKIDLAAIEAFFKDDKAASATKTASTAEPKKKVTPKTKSHTEPEKEPAPVEALKDVDLDANIDLKNVTYGPELLLECKSIIKIQKSIVSIPKLQILVNQIPINSEGEIDLGKADGYPYYFKANFNNLYLPPLIKAFVKNDYGKTKGNITSFSTAFRGKGFTTANVMKNFKGFLNADFQDIAIPNQLRDNEYVGILFLALDSVEKIAKNVPNLKDPQKLLDAIASSKPSVNNPNTIDFSEGTVRIAADNGKAGIQKCYFKGDPIDYFSVTGNVFLDRRLDLATETSFKACIIPLKIGGTLDEPKVNYEEATKDFVEKNAINILSNSESIGDAIQSGLGGLIKNSDKLLKLPLKK